MARVDPMVSAERFTAKIVAIANELHIPYTIQNMKVGEQDDFIMRKLVYGIKSYIAASGEETVSCNIKWPANWWQAVKERWLPAWAKQRWPVLYERHRMERTFYRAMCPHIEIPRHQGNEIHFQFLRAHDRVLNDGEV